MNTQLAFLGGGNMGRALISGLLRRGTRPERITVSDPVPEVRDSLRQDLGVTPYADNAEAIAGADIVVLAVKPQQAPAVLAPLVPALQARRPLLLSIAAGLRIASLSQLCGAGVAVVRAMPNRPALVGAGITGLFAPADLAQATRRAAEEVMRAVGEVVWVPQEEDLDTVTALSGSGPAYFFLVAEILAQAATELGLAPETARRLAVATLHGAGAQVYASDGNLERLRQEVTSRAGVTEAAVRTLEAGDLQGLFRAALHAGVARSRELGKPG